MGGNRTVDLFDFAGTGESTDDDADPDAYTIQTESLSLTNLAVDEWISVRGYPTEYGVANGDFSALSVNEVSWTTTAASFVAHWLLDDSDGVTIDADALILDTTRVRFACVCRVFPGKSAIWRVSRVLKRQRVDVMPSILRVRAPPFILTSVSF